MIPEICAGYRIPKGWKVILWLRYLHTNPENFDDPMCFNPERWNVRLELCSRTKPCFPFSLLCSFRASICNTWSRSSGFCETGGIPSVWWGIENLSRKHACENSAGYFTASLISRIQVRKKVKLLLTNFRRSFNSLDHKIYTNIWQLNFQVGIDQLGRRLCLSSPPRTS